MDCRSHKRGRSTTRRHAPLKLLHIFGLISLVMASLACSLFVGGPDLPVRQPVADAAPLESLESQIEQALSESARTGSISVRLTEAQLAAYLTATLGAQEPPLLRDLQVVLNDQRMVVYGRGAAGPLEANVSLAAEFSVDSEGLPEIQVTEATVGPLPMPPSLRTAMTTAIDEALTGSLGPVATGFRLESVQISEGVMTITGRIR